MTVLEVIQRSTEFLSRRGVDSPRLNAELLTAHVLGLPRLQLYLNFERPLTESQRETLRALVRRRGDREPLQHLTGSTSFCGLELLVTRDVLVPRPETEGLAELAWRRLQTSPSTPPRALDFGTGSGCLAIAVAVHCPRAEVHALDRSNEALTVARRNAATHQVTSRVHFHCGDGFHALPPNLPGEPAFDVLMSNPPYIPTAECDQLPPEVRDHDPRQALDGGLDGLDFYRVLTAEGARWLRPEGCLVLEIGDGQESAVSALAASHGWRVDALEKDLAGTPRILCLVPDR